MSAYCFWMNAVWFSVWLVAHMRSFPHVCAQSCRLAVSLGPYHNWPIYFGFSYVHRYKTPQTEQAITNEERKSLHVWKWDSEREKGWLSVLPACVCLCICMYDSLTCHLVTDTVGSEEKRMLCSRTVFVKCTKITEPALWPFCFSVLMLRTDTNKVPKAEETKKWKVWADTHLRTSHQFVFFCPPFPCMSSFVTASSCLLICSVVVCVCHGMRDSEHPLWTLCNFSQDF